MAPPRRPGVGAAAERPRPAGPHQLPLAWRLALACVLPALLALALVGGAATLSTTRAFGRFAASQDRAALAASIQTYYARSGSLNGYRSPYQLAGASGTPPGNPPPEAGDDAGPPPWDDLPPPQGPGSRGVPPREPPRGAGQDRLPGPPPAPDGLDRSPYLVLDSGFRTVLDTPERAAGTSVPQDVRRAASPVRYGGQVIAYLAPSRFTSRPDPRAQLALRQTLGTLLLAVAAAVVGALLLGTLLARTLLRPVTALQRAIRAVQRGEPHPPLGPAAGELRRPDEFGELLAAFDGMRAELERSQRARQRLTADIAHDLNTPLSVMGGTLEALLDGTFAPTPERLSRLKRETDHLRRLVSDLRLLALADAGELPLHRVPTDVAALLSEAAERVRPLADLGGVRLHLEAPTSLPPVPLDPARLHQVLQNLLGNALAHTPPGGAITLSADMPEAGTPGAAGEGAQLLLHVRDTGSGIAPEALPLVFDRLYRADSARAEGGSGLGLSICKSVAEAHGGRVGALSRPGEGTHVWVQLPLQVPVTAPAATALCTTSEQHLGRR